MTIITIITLFGTLTGTSGQLTDLCDITNPKIDRPLYCQPHHEGAPEWEGAVCCDSESCVQADALGACAAGRKAYFCELGELMADNTVSCYFEVPNHCDVFQCEPRPPGFSAEPQANTMCCSQGWCWGISHTEGDCEEGDITWCSDGVTNDNGTVTCFDVGSPWTWYD